MSAAPAAYFRIDFTCADAEEQSWQLFELGVAGVEIRGPQSLSAYLPAADESEAETFAAVAGALGFQKQIIEAVPDRNWTQLAHEVLEPVRIGALRIDPVADPDSAVDARSADSIRLVPGQGFGTGHHASTRQALLLLQHPELREKVRAVLDFGTGSGILALAAAKLFGAKVLGLDVSPDALENARTNVELNDARPRIRLQQGGADAAAGKYDLITANIYAELLIEFEPNFRKAAPRLIAAGILDELSGSVLEAYRPHWAPISSAVSEGWSAFLFQRRRRPAGA